MQNLDHPNVMGLIGICLNAGPSPLIALPYMEGMIWYNNNASILFKNEGGSLLKYLIRNRENLMTCESTDEDEV